MRDIIEKILAGDILMSNAFLVEGKTKIIVKDGSACGGNPNTSKFFCNLDESVLSGILMERHGRKVSTSKRECMETKNCSCFYEINFEE